MRKTCTAHNEMEVRALIEESFQQGSEEAFHGTKWHKHDSEELICISRMDTVGYHLDFKNFSIYKEL